MNAIRLQSICRWRIRKDCRETPQDQIDLDDLKMIITRLGRLLLLMAISYLCFENVFHEVDVVLSSYPAKMDGRCDLLHIIIHLERH